MFDPDYLSVKLALLEEGGDRKILTKDGEVIVSRTADFSDEDLMEQAYHYILGMTLRGKRNGLALTGKLGYLPYLELPPDKVHMLRKAALLRGWLPYLRAHGARKMLGWSKFDEIKPRLERFDLYDKTFVYSCDSYAAQFPPDRWYEIYSNGSTATGKGFRTGDIYELADANGVVCQWDNFFHKLEDGPADPKWVPPPVIANDATPEEIERVKQKEIPRKMFPILPAREFHKSTPMMRRNVNDYYKKEKNDADIPQYLVGTEKVNRYQYMQHICFKMTEGLTLSDLCKGVNGQPFLWEVAKWAKQHPDFARDMANAEQVQAHVFADKALKVVTDCPADKDAISLARLKHKAYMDRAALQSNKWQPKQLIQTENLNDKTAQELRIQLVNMLQDKPEIISGELSSPKEPLSVGYTMSPSQPPPSEEEFYEDEEEGPSE